VHHLPMVAGLAYRERIEPLPAEFPATLRVEPDNPYNPCAVAVIGPGGKVGYVAPEVARNIYESVADGRTASCLVRRGNFSPTTGILGFVELER
jgi:hypothetical protein